MSARLFAVASCLLAPVAALAWDPAGHMLVDQIAWEESTPAVRERVQPLVQRLEKTYNDGQTYNFITAGCWMDDMRSKKGYAWSAWHYVNMPWTADGVAFEVPPPPHVLWAIDESLKTLKTPDLAPEKAAEALAMILHFVADVHQPMHATERGDRGGNGVLVTGVPFTDLWTGTRANLHAFWDKAFRFDQAEGKTVEVWKAPAIPAERPSHPDAGVIAAEAAKIRAEYPAEQLQGEIAKLDPVEWARESHRLGCLSGYPREYQPSDVHVVALTSEFVAQSRIIANRRIALAGYRLARVLNDVFGQK